MKKEKIGTYKLLDIQSLDAIFLFYFILFFIFSSLFSLFGSRVRVRVTSWSHCHTSVTLDNIVTVIVTSYKVTKKGSGKMISYNMYNICWP